MKKKILSQLFIVSFAFAGLFLVGNNVFGKYSENSMLKPIADNEIINRGPRQVMRHCHGAVRLSCGLDRPYPCSYDTCALLDSQQ